MKKLLIDGPGALQEFRDHWTGNEMIELLQQHDGKCLITWPVGIGKSYNIDNVIESAVYKNIYDLVLVFLPTTAVLKERRWVLHPPAEIKTTVLRPRPSEKCGINFDTRWKTFEENCMGALGRMDLCNNCHYQWSCFWPTQYGKALIDSQVIFANQVHLERDSQFITKLRIWTGAKNILVILDESNFMVKQFTRKITKQHLHLYLKVLEYMGMTTSEDRTMSLVKLLTLAKTSDLRTPNWKIPFPTQKDILEIQQEGFAVYGEQFRFLAYDLQQFCHSPLTSREKDIDDNVSFATPLGFKTDLLIYSGTSELEYARSRLGCEISAPFSDHSFLHSGTQWYNIASRIGMKIYFQRHLSQVLDFFSQLIHQRLIQGKKPLLISKMCFKNICAREIESRLLNLGHHNIRVVTEDWENETFADSSTIPLIHYGVIGVNTFQDFDAAYCLNGYYINPPIINTALQDIYATDFKIDIEIGTTGIPLRRWARAYHSDNRFCDVNWLAHSALKQQEMGIVIQAAGRVRPFTKPREIVTFQCSENPQLEYTKEFISLEPARNFFGIQSKRTRCKHQNIEAIRNAKNGGLTQKEAAAELGLGLSTIKRHWGS